MKKMKAQFGIMEYILLSVFLLAILAIGIFMLFGFEQFKEKGQGTKELTSRQLLSMSIFTHSNMFAKSDMLLLDDSKLFGFVDDAACDDVEKITGQQACIEMEALLPSAKEDKQCDIGTYPNCNKWTICKQICDSKSGFRILAMPVNIFRKIQNRVDLGMLTFKVPS